MKICFISREYISGNHIGGIGTYTSTAAEILAEKGNDVHVLTYGHKQEVLNERNIIIHRLPMRPHHLPAAPLFYHYRRLYRKHLPVYLDAVTWAKSVERYFCDHLIKEKFNVIEYPDTMGEGTYLPGDLNCLSVCRIHFSPLVAIARNSLERYMLRKLERKSCEKAGQLVAPSNYVVSEYGKKQLGINKEIFLSRNPVSLWPQPVDWETKKVRNILFVGRIEYRKGIQVLVRAMKRLSSHKKIKFHLKIIGNLHNPANPVDKETSLIFKNFLDENNSSEKLMPFSQKVEYLGAVPHKDLYKYYDWAGLLLLPSLEENYPYVAIEALSRGCFIIGSDTGGIPEIVTPGTTGQLFHSGNDKDLYEKIQDCLNKHDIIERKLKSIEKKTAQIFSRDNCYRELIKTYGPSNTMP